MSSPQLSLTSSPLVLLTSSSLSSPFEVTDGERLTLAMWFSRDSSHDEDSKLVSHLSQCKPNEFCLLLPASANMYWFCPQQDTNQDIGFDICVARLYPLGFDVHSLQDKDRSLDASEQLMGPLQIAKGGELLNRKFTIRDYLLGRVHS